MPRSQRDAVLTIDDLFSIGRQAIGQVASCDTLQPAVPWIEEHFVDPITKRSIQLHPIQKRILRHALQYDESGHSRYSLVVWSQPKKSGKTAVAAAVGAWVANCVEVPNEISCVANDQEQSASRIFAAMLPTLASLGWEVPDSPRSTLAYNRATGSVVEAITTRYQGEAGGNQGITLWSELWAYSGERLNRLWDELTPPPTRKFAMRWVETYAGFRQESLLLYGFYRRVFADNSEKTLNPGVVKLWNDLPVYAIPDERMLVYWDHIPRMSWQTFEYYATQRAQLRPTAYARLHTNTWVDSSESFITQEMWDASLGRQGPLLVPAIYALDAAKNDDCVALVGCVRIGTVVHVADVHVWESNGSEYDYNEIMRRILELWHNGLLKPPLYYDPYQAVKLAQDLRAAGLACEEFSQGAERVRADTCLYKLFRSGSIVCWNHPQLRQHVLAAHAKRVGGDKEEYRIVKPDAEGGQQASGRHLQKVDAAVAMSMSAYMAYTSSTKSGGWAISGV